MQNGVIKSYINRQNITQCTTAMTAVGCAYANFIYIFMMRRYNITMPAAGCAYALSAMALVLRAISFAGKNQLLLLQCLRWSLSFVEVRA
ncbi:hypothetical protein [Nostoc favosum]|uniref:Uncharacterized protein n=1 Tax=Nostoc favosum CHAB5714 TaxID=2780399 RepID=A0ABS8IEP6_9NOSO|nr:hypothetical protein [Nostoc favosum]MCC5602311.1 hypothetical protein [Nostoc favosum CHAB5714]